MLTEKKTKTQIADWEFKYERLTKSETDELSCHVAKLNLETNGAFYPVKDFWGRIKLCRKHRWSCVLVTNSCKPPQLQLIAYWNGTLFFPTEYKTQRASFFHQLEISTIEQAIAYHEICRCEFAALNKQTLPVIISNDEGVAKHHGFDSLDRYSDYLANGFSLCWQEWEGIVYAFKIDVRSNDPFIEWQEIDSCVGCFKKLPFFAFR